MKVQVKNEDGTTTTIETPKIETKDDKTTVTITDSATQKKNPVVTNSEQEVYFTAAQGLQKINISVSNGVLNGCTIDYNNSCTISGITGKISKITEGGWGQDISGARIFFIMEDGSVEYVKHVDLIDNKAATAKKVNISGFVTDTIFIAVTDGLNGSGGLSTLFVLSNGSLVEATESMLN